MLNSSLITSRWNIFSRTRRSSIKYNFPSAATLGTFFRLFVPFSYVIPYGIDRKGSLKFVHMEFYLRKITFALS